MESSVVVAVVAGAAGAAAMLLLVTVVLLATRRRRARPDLEAALAAARAETDELRQRLDALSRPVLPQPDHADYVITHVGEDGAGGSEELVPVAVPDRLVLSATVGVPLVKAAAFSHGVRRALSAESRNRIWFEVRREVRASRRRRRQLRKHLEREYRARLRAHDDPVMEGPA